jgi:hypothetical protein
MKKILISFFALTLLIGAGFFIINNWGFVFSKTVNGTIESVERITSQTAIIATGRSNVQSEEKNLFSFAIAIKDFSGEYFTSSSEDRQWAVAKVGQCVIARFYPYAPWTFDKNGTFHNARLIKLEDCPEK